VPMSLVFVDPSVDRTLGPGLYPDICFRGGVWYSQGGGRSSGRRPRVSRGAKRRVEERSGEGCPPPQYEGPGVLPPGKF